MRGFGMVRGYLIFMERRDLQVLKIFQFKVIHKKKFPNTKTKQETPSKP
ncbi:unnamed protein product [Moneuplotes crassus]|uniref:Uncharacterized protein n=1 Tax=Euplotes crassus TaxID=5936 RepID=A0AAD1XT93_EUPCR|nr:unnamed protein product [Moneuplotes crassus]